MNSNNGFPMRYKDRYILKLKDYYIIGWLRTEIRADIYEAKDSYMSLKAYQALLQEFDAKAIPMIGENYQTNMQELRDVSCFTSLENCKMAIEHLESLYSSRELSYEEELLKLELDNAEIKKEDLIKAMDQMLLDEELEKELLQEDEPDYFVDITQTDIEEYLKELMDESDNNSYKNKNIKHKKNKRDTEN